MCTLLVKKSSKAAFTITFFAAVCHHYDHKQRTLKHRKSQNGSKSTYHKSQTMTFWTLWSKLVFPKRSAKMIGVWHFFLTRGSNCTNHRKTILIACFLRGHLNVVNPMRDDLDFVWSEIFSKRQEEAVWIKFGDTVSRNVSIYCWSMLYCMKYRALNLQMHTLLAVGPH